MSQTPPAAEPRTVACPTCRRRVAWLPENRYRPFCSERCRRIDLGAWASGEYTIAAATPADGEAETD